MHSAGVWFSLAVAGIGWFYLFGSRSARGLESIEAAAVNRRRVRLRGWNGACMIVLGICLFAGMYSIVPESRPGMFVADWIAVMFLLAASVALALADIRLTMRLRRSAGGQGGEA